MSASVAVVTPWLGHLELWEEYERALDLGPPPDETIIVDNGSDPPLWFAAIRNDTNLGFARACNQGLDHATADVVVFLNNDVWAAEAGWLMKLTAAVEPGVLAGARLRYDQHTTVDGRLLPYLDGWCLAGLRDELQELGGFNETLEEPAYYSDNLLCLEARAAGFTLREAQIGLIHKQGVTSQPATNPDVAAATVANQARYEQHARELLAQTTERSSSVEILAQ